MLFFISTVKSSELLRTAGLKEKHQINSLLNTSINLMLIFYLESCQWEEYFPEKETEKQGENWLRGSRKIKVIFLV